MGGLAELREKIGGDLAEIQDDGLAVDIVAHPARIVPGGDRDVGVPELRRHVPQLNARGQQLRGVRVAEILEPSVAELRALENPPPLATTEVARIHLGEDQLVGAGLEPRPVERPQRAPQ